MFCSQDSKIFVFLTILWILNISFEYIFWTTTYKVTKLGQLIDVCKDKKFSGIIWTIWRTEAKFQVLFNLATCLNYSITNYVKIPLFHVFEKVNKGQLKVANVSY